MIGEAAVPGGSLRYEVAGEGPALVFVHGFCLDLRMWQAQWQALQGEHLCIRYDCRGFGASSLPGDEAYTHGDDLAALLDHLEVESADVVGLSMGAQVALELACGHGARCERLVLADSFLSGYRLSRDWMGIVKPVVEVAMAGDVAHARSLWLHSALFAPTRENPSARATLDEIVGDYSGWHWQNPGQSGHADVLERLGDVGQETLLVIGERDLPDFHEMADHLHERLANTRCVRLDTGHVSNLHDPDAFSTALQDFLS